MCALRIRYQTVEFGDVDIHIRSLRDRQEYRDDKVAAQHGISQAQWSLFGVVWDSGIQLARLMFNFNLRGRRILEVGCGIGVTSLVLNHRGADITATDRHPESANFLKKNVLLNDGKPIPFVRTGWAEPLQETLGTFDLIVGSDLLYERGQAAMLSSFIERHARKNCEVIIVDPKRGYGSRFRRAMLEQGYTYQAHETTMVVPGEKEYRGLIMGFTRADEPIAEGAR